MTNVKVLVGLNPNIKYVFDNFYVYTKPVYKIKYLHCDKCNTDRMYILTKTMDIWRWEFNWEEHLTNLVLNGNEKNNLDFARGMIQARPHIGIRLKEFDPFQKIAHILCEPKYTSHKCHILMR